MPLTIVEHGEWERYKPDPLPAGVPPNAMFARRVSDGADWYGYLRAATPNFAPNTVKMTLGNLPGRGWTVYAATKDATALFPQSCLVIEVAGIADADPQEAYGRKVFNRQAGTFSDFVRQRTLAEYAAEARLAKETGGIDVGPANVATDRQSQAMITGAFLYVQQNPAATIRWKKPNGRFVTLSAAQISAVAQAVGAHVQACFAAEASVQDQIEAGTITTTAQIDAVFAAI